MLTSIGTHVMAYGPKVTTFFLENTQQQQKLTKQAFAIQFAKLTTQYLSENESPERDSFFKPPSSTLPTSGSEAIAKEIEELLATGLDANIPQAHFEYAKMILSEDIQVKDFTTNKYSLACQHFELAAQQGHCEAALYAARMLIGTAFNNVEGLVIAEYDDTRLDKIHAYYQIAAETNANAAKEYLLHMQKGFGYLPKLEEPLTLIYHSIRYLQKGHIEIASYALEFCLQQITALTATSYIGNAAGIVESLITGKTKENANQYNGIAVRVKNLFEQYKQQPQVHELIHQAENAINVSLRM